MTKKILALGLLAGVALTAVSVATWAADKAPTTAHDHAAMLAQQAGMDLKDMKEMYKRPADIPFPKDNAYSDAKYDLGKQLFFDPRLSRSKVMSCATCHNPSFSWGDGLAKGVGDKHNPLGRRTPTAMNLAWDTLFFWDGRAASLEEQALGPIASPGEMNMPHETMIADLKQIAPYHDAFAKAFPGEADPVTKENVAKAIATFERKIVSGKAPFDKWIEGDDKAISESAQRGFVIFNTKGQCATCHSGWNFGNSAMFHDLGLKDDDIGRAKIVTDDPNMQHAFKTVGLRNIAERGPYMHDGSLPTLEAVVDHYNNGFEKRETVILQELNLTDEEKKDLVEFMKSLTSVDDPVTLPILPR